MMMFPTALRTSPLHGVGVFILAPVKKGEVVWRFDSRVDRIYTETEILGMPSVAQAHLRKYAFWHKPTGHWMYCGDNARHFNHSEQPTAVSTSAGFGDDVAARDLMPGDELTNDYRMSCDMVATTGQLYR